MFGAILVLSSLTEQNGELKSPPKYFCFNYLVISGRNSLWSQFSKQLALIRSLGIFGNRNLSGKFIWKEFQYYLFFFFFQCGWIISFLGTVSWNCFSEQKYKMCNPALQPHIQNAEKLQGGKDRIWGNCPWKKSIG